ncbi:TPA: hypothetical protein F3L15_06450 [Aeromonas hydrophila]|uniref:hypothetical protein n=1 Tax=Aeromonas hydrophila TaxID=644 RepID=UPI0009BB19DC|nr:hypothetical protein [Aeromonas hydrophila]HAU4883662.1 hypothetical protein [Aeromonas hydrophila]
MTIAVAWVRTLNNCKELVVVSDSRLNGGKKMDCGQKIIVLPRSDAFICFAGDTSWAYPLMHQVTSAIDLYDRCSSRAQDIKELKTYVLKIFERLRDQVHDAIGNEDVPDAKFIFGGYSWVRKKFMIWHITYSTSTKSFKADPASEINGSPCLFTGDKEHVDFAKSELIRVLEARGKYDKRNKRNEHFKFEWEPFEVIRDMLRHVNDNACEFSSSSIGGAPQVLKIYEHLSSQMFGVLWKNRNDINEEIYYSGRRLANYGPRDIWVLKPDELITYNPLRTHSEKIVINKHASRKS